MASVPASNLDVLAAMGFHPETARAALRSANLDRALAVEALLGAGATWSMLQEYGFVAGSFPG